MATAKLTAALRCKQFFVSIRNTTESIDMRIGICLLIFTIHVGAAQESTVSDGPYRSTWTIDGAAVSGAIVVAFSAAAIDDDLPVPSIAEITALNRNDVNALDRWAAGTYRKNHLLPSDLALFAAFGSPLALLIDERIRNDWGTIALMYIEMGVLSNFSPSFGKGSVKRYRPYVYNNSVPMSERRDIESLRSFFSGHATRSFAAGVMTAIMYEDYFPDSEYRTVVWIASLGLASSSAIFRVTSGAHFPSDVLVGAVVGSGIGYLIPYIHRNPPDDLSLIPVVSPSGTGMMLSFRF
jgi:membrane-associated phospholipid phosphatase